MKITKEYLTETREVIVHLKEMAMDITRLKERAVSTPSQLFSDVRVQTSRKTDPMADRVVEYADLEELYARTYSWYLDRNSEIQRAISPLPFREQLVVIWYYLCGETVPEICGKLYICKETFYRYLRKALAHIAEIDENAVI